MLSQLNPINKDIKILKESAAEVPRQKLQIDLLKKQSKLFNGLPLSSRGLYASRTQRYGRRI